MNSFPIKHVSGCPQREVLSDLAQFRVSKATHTHNYKVYLTGLCYATGLSNYCAYSNINQMSFLKAHILIQQTITHKHQTCTRQLN